MPVATHTEQGICCHNAQVMHTAPVKRAVCQRLAHDWVLQDYLERPPACRSYTTLPRDCFCWCPFCKPFCMGAAYVKYGSDEGSLSGRPTIGGALLEGLVRVCWKPLRSGGRLCERSNTSCPTSASAKQATPPEQWVGNGLHAPCIERLPKKACQEWQYIPTDSLLLCSAWRELLPVRLHDSPEVRTWSGAKALRSKVGLARRSAKMSSKLPPRAGGTEGGEDGSPGCVYKSIKVSYNTPKCQSSLEWPP